MLTALGCEGTRDMGWRAWDAYDQDAKDRWRALPWRERYNWRHIVAFALIVAFAAIVLWANIAHAQSAKLTDAQVADKIIQVSREDYYATGHPCACPYDRAQNGSSCGGRSAYSRPGGAEPKCFPKDVSKAEIITYRNTHP
jgi:hypothetical protein